MAKIKYETIKPDVLIDIQISGYFYRRMVDLLTMLSESVLLEDFKKVLEKLKDNNPAADMFELNVHTIMSLIYEVEKQSKIQNKTSETEIDVEDEKDLIHNEEKKCFIKQGEKVDNMKNYMKQISVLLDKKPKK